MSDFVQRLLEAIEARAARARAASPGPWRANAEHDEVHAVDGEVVCEGFALSSNQLRATVDFIVDNDPATVLRHSEADRAVVNRCLERRDGYVFAQFVLEHLARAYSVSVDSKED